jgi:hypothetical protein
MYQPAMKARIGELAQQKGEIEARLAEAPAELRGGRNRPERLDAPERAL